MNFNKIWNALSTGAKIAGIAGIVLIVNIFLPWYGIGSGAFSVNLNAFDAGFLAWGGSIFVIAGAVLVILDEIGTGNIAAGGLKGSQIGLILAGFGTLLVVLRFITETSLTRFGLFIGILAAAAATYGSFASLKASGTGLPSADDFRFPGGGDEPPPPPQA